jgi:hypothetical protein
MLKIFDKNITKKIKQMSKVCFRTYILNAICDVLWCKIQQNQRIQVMRFNQIVLNY